MTTPTSVAAVGTAMPDVALAGLAARGVLGVPALLVVPGTAQEAARLAARVPEASAADGVSAWASGTGHAEAGLGTFLTLQHSGTFLVDADGMIRYRRTAT